MLRTFILLLIGVAVGAAATWVLQSDHWSPGITSNSVVVHEDGRQVARKSPEFQSAFVSGSDSHTSRETFYGLVADADEDDLLALIDEAVSLSSTSQRQFSIEILFSRYAEMNPAAAISLANTMRIDPGVTASLYATWFRHDAAKALGALRQESSLAVARLAGLDLVDEMGGGSDALLEVLDSLPENIDRVDFHIDVLVRRAAHDPLGAISEANGFVEANLQSGAMARIGAAIASRDPQEALAYSVYITEEVQRTSFERQVIQEWAATDPSAVFDYIGALDVSGQPERQVAQAAFSSLARSDPERLLNMANEWGGDIAQHAQYRALNYWSNENPTAALAYANELPRGQQRDRLMQSVAKGYGKQDIEAGLAWADSLKPRPRGIYSSLLQGLADEDADRAFDIAMSLDSGSTRREAIQSVAMQVINRGEDAARFAGKVMALEEGQTRTEALQMLSYMWAHRDPDGAVKWLVANAAGLPAESFRGGVRQVAESDPQLAADFTSRVPANKRPEWIRQVATEFAKSSPDEALAWISQFQGEEGYSAGVAAIAQSTAQQDPIAAARNIDTYQDPNQATLIAQTAGHSWAEEDPASAARWATGIGNEQVRQAAIATVARGWVGSDVEAAKRWVMTLPSGQGRDDALSAVLSGVASKGMPEQSLLDAFSTDMARQQAVVRAVYRLAQVDSTAAKQLADRYVTDPTLRGQLDRNLASYLLQ